MKITLADLRAERGVKIDAMTALTESREFDPKKFETLKGEVAALDLQIAAAEEAQRHAASLAKPVGAAEPIELVNPLMSVSAIRSTAKGPLRGFADYLGLTRSATGFKPDPQKHFRSLGEQLQAVAQYANSRGSRQDARLVRAPADTMRAPSGGSEVDPSGGGFLVQTDFSTAIFMLAHDVGDLLGRVNKLPISANANGIKIPGVDETSRANGSRWGGVASSWQAEGNTTAATKPTFRLKEFDLKKLISIAYVTDELLQDSDALTAIYGQAFSEEVMFMTEDAIYEGTGAGQPQGIMNSQCRITVPKEKGQASGTIVYENLLNMYSRMWARSRKNGAWYINQDIEPQLFSLNQAIGTAGYPVYLPPGGLSGAPYASLFGRPVVPLEYASTLGTEGDIMFGDFSQYTLIDKGGVQAATSMHVAFLTDEMVFRITYRVDGQTMWTKPITPFKGTNTHSPFITLASR